ncbi:hypothetical protein D8S78_03710 [Natrialba swarupiae]|nr:hypothetical protein [Natrialba swarupiae]
MAENWDESSESSRDERSPAPSVTARPGRREVLSSVGLVVSVPITGCLAGAPAERSDTETESAIDSRSASNSGGDDTSEHSGGSQSRSAALRDGHRADGRNCPRGRRSIRSSTRLAETGRARHVDQPRRPRPTRRRPDRPTNTGRRHELAERRSREGERFERAFDREGLRLPLYAPRGVPVRPARRRASGSGGRTR